MRKNNGIKVCAKPPHPLAPPLGELSAKLTERALKGKPLTVRGQSVKEAAKASPV